MEKPPRVALLIESSRGYGRDLLCGIANYVQAHGPWSIYHQERALSEAAPAWMKNWHGDGIITRILNRKLIQQIREFNLPTVDLRRLYHIKGVPTVNIDDHEVVRLAVDHLLERGLENFAFCGFARADYSEARCKYFCEYLSETGRNTYVFEGSKQSRSVNTSVLEARGMLDEHSVAVWLKSLPKPLGLMACNDVRAQQVLNACTEHGIKVPEEVAVIGVNNDEVLCQLSYPSLSSVDVNAAKIGYEAAALLDRMMQSQSTRQEEHMIKPMGVIQRESTDVLAIADQDVAAAVHFIRNNACNDIHLEDVLQHVCISPSTLRRRFTKCMGRSPRAEIIRVQLQRVQELLTRTEFPLTTIAEMAGFKHVEVMSKLFKRKTGQTPGKYRKTSRTG